MNNGTSFLWVKQPEVLAARSPLPSKQMRNAWTYTINFHTWLHRVDKKKYIVIPRGFVKCYDFRKTLDSTLPFPVYIVPAAKGGNFFQMAVLINLVVCR